MNRSKADSRSDSRSYGIGDRWGLWTVTVGLEKVSGEESTFLELLKVSTVDPLSANFEFFSETVGAESKLSFSIESGDQSRVTSVSKEKLLAEVFIGLLKFTVSSKVPDSQLSVLKDFKMIFIILRWLLVRSFQFQFLLKFHNVEVLSRKKLQRIKSKLQKIYSMMNKKKITMDVFRGFLWTTLFKLIESEWSNLFTSTFVKMVIYTDCMVIE